MQTQPRVVVTVPLTLSNLAAFKRQQLVDGAAAHRRVRGVSQSGIGSQDHAGLGSESTPPLTSSPFRVPTPTASTSQFRARLAETDHNHIAGHDDGVDGEPRGRLRTGDVTDAASFFAEAGVSGLFGADAYGGRHAARTPPPPVSSPSLVVNSPAGSCGDGSRGRSVGDCLSVNTSPRDVCSPRSARACTPPPPVSHDQSPRPEARPFAAAECIGERGSLSLLCTPPRQRTLSPPHAVSSPWAPVSATAAQPLDRSPAPRVPHAHSADIIDADARAQQADTKPAFARGASPLLAMYYMPASARASLPMAGGLGLSPRKPAQATVTTTSPREGSARESMTPSRWAGAVAARKVGEEEEEADGGARAGASQATAPRVALLPESNAPSNGTTAARLSSLPAVSGTMALRMSTLSGHVWETVVDRDHSTVSDLVEQVAARLGFPAVQLQLKHVESGWCATATPTRAGASADHDKAASHATLVKAAPFVKMNDLFLVILATPSSPPPPQQRQQLQGVDGQERRADRHSRAEVSRQNHHEARRRSSSRRADKRRKVDVVVASTPARPADNVEDVAQGHSAARPTAPVRAPSSSSPARGGRSQGRGVPPPVIGSHHGPHVRDSRSK